METALSFAEKHFEDSVETLKSLVRIPSVSFDGFPKEEVERSAKAVAELLKSKGLENVELLTLPDCHPYVYADWLHAPGKPTLLLYAHHDVQPPMRTELWKTPPFEPTQIGDRLFGRGTADDKAGIIVHVAAIEAYLKTVKTIPVNVKLLIEGEEEIGSGHLGAFLREHRTKLKADCIVLIDTGNYDVGIPTITTSLRGLVAMEVKVKVMKQPLHSGTWGGPGPDPVIALSKMIASVVDKDGRIAIPGIYDKVRPLLKVEKESLDSLHYTDADFRSQAGLLDGVQILGGPASPQEKMTRLPSFSVNAIQASSKASAANVVMEEAWCKLGIRIVPDMDGKEVESLLKNHLLKNAPWGVKVEFGAVQNAPWWITKPEGKAFAAMSQSLEAAFGQKTVYMGSGGTIPFIQPFAEILGGAPSLLVGVEDPFTNAHSENESVHLGDLKKSILAAIRFYDAAAK